MKYNIFCLLFVMFALNGCASKGQNAAGQAPAQNTAKTATATGTGTGTLVIKPIKFAKEAYIREAVKKECDLLGKLTQFTQSYAQDQYAQIMTDGKSIPRSAQLLTMEIEQVQGGGGGAWSGAKVVLINGTLTQNGKLLGSFKARRYSGGGMFAAYKGTCSILGRCVKALGRDVAEWLRNPTKKAVLGDL